MNAERLAEVARIIERLAPADTKDDEQFLGSLSGSFITSANEHATITQFDMRMYHGTQVRGSAACGCIAGVTIQHWPDEAATYAGSSTNVEITDDVAGQILGLRPEVAKVLFHCRKHRGDWALSRIRPEEAASACRRLAAGETLDHIWKQSRPRSGEAH